MKSITFYYIAAVAFIVLACSQNQQRATAQPHYSQVQELDTSRYAVIATTPIIDISDSDVQTIYLLITKAVDSVNKSRSLENKIQLDRYKFQIVPLNDQAGERKYRVNAFCDNKIVNWRNELYAFNMEEDSGCFFNLKVNATVTSYYDFSFKSHT